MLVNFSIGPEPKEIDLSDLSTGTPQTTALAVRSAAAGMAAYVPQNLEQALKICDYMSKAKTVPVAYQGQPADIFLAVAFGAELGLSPAAALKAIHVIKGKTSLYADAAHGVCLGHPKCERFVRVPVEDPTTIATFEVMRSGWTEPQQFSFTMAEAEVGGLLSNANYKKFPARMLEARCKMIAARLSFPDLLAGVYCPEEIIDMVEDTPNVFVAPSSVVDAEVVSDDADAEVQVDVTVEVQVEDDTEEDDTEAAFLELVACISRTKNGTELDALKPRCSEFKKAHADLGAKLLVAYTEKRQALKPVTK